MSGVEVFLEHLKGERAGAQDRFAKDVIRVGRAAELDLIFEDQGVSYEHAELRLRDGDFWLVDLGSTNGSFVNEERSQNARLRDGDVLRFGKKGPTVRFRLTAPSAAAAPSAQARPSGSSEDVLSDLPPLAPVAQAPAPATRPKSRRAPTMPAMPALDLGAPTPPAAAAPLRRASSGGRPALPPLPIDRDSSSSADSGASDSGSSDSSSGGSAGTSSVGPSGGGAHRPIVITRASKTATIAAVVLAFVALFTGSLAVAFWLELGHSSQLLEAEVLRSEQLKKELKANREASALHERELEARYRDQNHESVDRLEKQLDKAHKSEKEAVANAERLQQALNKARQDLSQLSTASTQRDSRAWKQVESRVQRSVVLVFTQFDLKKKDGSRELFQCSGSGFFISKDGYLITNKHVCEPWKFRPLAVRLVQEGLEVDMASYKLAVWIAGSKFAEGNQLLIGNGFSTDQGTLERVREPVDRWTTLTLPGDSGPRLMKVHDDASNEDLCLLRAKGNSFEPIPLRRSNEGNVEKLDQVLVIGFPAGPSILEKGVAETTVTPGVVRKVEETIYVSGGIIGGNSGGPVLDGEGRVIGVATRVVSGTESFGSCLKIEHVIELFEGGSW